MKPPNPNLKNSKIPKLDKKIFHMFEEENSITIFLVGRSVGLEKRREEKRVEKRENRIGLEKRREEKRKQRKKNASVKSIIGFHSIPFRHLPPSLPPSPPPTPHSPPIPQTHHHLLTNPLPRLVIHSFSFLFPPCEKNLSPPPYFARLRLRGKMGWDVTLLFISSRLR